MERLLKEKGGIVQELSTAVAAEIRGRLMESGSLKTSTTSMTLNHCLKHQLFKIRKVGLVAINWS